MERILQAKSSIGIPWRVPLLFSFSAAETIAIWPP
jgi:hypothetical protein